MFLLHISARSCPHFTFGACHKKLKKLIAQCFASFFYLFISNFLGQSYWIPFTQLSLTVSYQRDGGFVVYEQIEISLFFYLCNQEPSLLSVLNSERCYLSLFFLGGGVWNDSSVLFTRAFGFPR